MATEKSKTRSVVDDEDIEDCMNDAKPSERMEPDQVNFSQIGTDVAPIDGPSR